MTYMRDEKFAAADRAAAALAKRIGLPDWLAGIGVGIVDDGTFDVEVGVLPGARPNLPTSMLGVPVRVVVRRRAVAYDHATAQSAGRGNGIPHPYPPGTRYGLVRRDNLRRAWRR